MAKSLDGWLWSAVWERHRVSSFKSCDILQMMTSLPDRKYFEFKYLSKYLQCSFNQQIWKYFSMEISNEKCSAADGIYQMTTKVCRDRRTTRLVELDWFACTPRTVPPLPPPLHPVLRSRIWDLGFFNPYQVILSGEKYFKSQKNPTPGLWHRRRRCCAEPEYQLHTWLISSCQWLLHPRSLLDLKMQPFLTLFVWFDFHRGLQLISV